MEPSSDAEDVRINGHGRPAEREHGHAGDSLGSDAVEAAEPISRFLKGEIVEEGEVIGTGAIMDLAEDGLDARSFRRREATGLYRLDQVGQWCVCDGVP